MKKSMGYLILKELETDDYTTNYSKDISDPFICTGCLNEVVMNKNNDVLQCPICETKFTIK